MELDGKWSHPLMILFAILASMYFFCKKRVFLDGVYQPSTHNPLFLEHRFPHALPVAFSPCCWRHISELSALLPVPYTMPCLAVSWEFKPKTGWWKEIFSSEFQASLKNLQKGHWKVGNSKGTSAFVCRVTAKWHCTKWMKILEAGWKAFGLLPARDENTLLGSLGKVRPGCKLQSVGFRKGSIFLIPHQSGIR